MSDRKERQSHGFSYEDNILKRYNIEKSDIYTSEYDTKESNIPLQIKNIQYGGDIELGSYKRNKNKKSDFFLYIGFWKDHKSNIVDEVVYRINYKEWIKNLEYDKDSQMFAEMDLISNLHEDDERWNDFCNRHKKRWDEFDNKIAIRLKRDHKNQKRIQCAIPLRYYNTWFKSTFEQIPINKFQEILNDIKQSLHNDKKGETMIQNKIQKVGLSRNKDGVSKDQYYTKPEIAQKYIETFLDIVQISNEDLVIEPSAGDGSFSNILKGNCNLLSYDIDPKLPDITELDFLTIDTTIFENIRVHCIGNPPFGSSGKLAKQFIKKCCEFSQSVSFILPKSFKKPSCYRVFPMRFHKIYEEDCPKKSFIVNGREYDAQCVFQIWIKKDIERNKEEVSKPMGYTFVKNNKHPHIALTRVGGSSGKAHLDYQEKSVESHLFIKFNDNIINNLDLQKFVSQLNEIKHEFNNTAGPRSISKSEFIPLINEQLRKYFDTCSL